jgi:hypothetical protein
MSRDSLLSLLKEEIVKTVLDCDGDTSKMDISTVLNLAKKIDLNSLLEGDDLEAGFEDIESRMNEARARMRSAEMARMSGELP